MEEIWKDVKGFEGLYQISNLGNVKSCAKRFVNWKGYVCNRKEASIKKFINKCGYHRVTLYKNAKPYHFTVHRLVATAFLKNPNNYTDINHIDFNKTNNCVNNLEWCSRSYNVKHAIKHNPNILEGIKITSKLLRKPIIQMTKNGIFIKEYESVFQASKITGISTSHICSVANKKPEKGQTYIRKSAGGYFWKYK